MGTGIQSMLYPVVSGVLGVTAEGEETPNSGGEMGVSSPVEGTEDGKQATLLPGSDTVGACSCSELLLLAAVATAVNVPKEGFAPHVCAASLLAMAVVDGKEAEAWAVLADDKNNLNSWRREEDRGLLLHFLVPSTVKEAWVLIAHSSLVFGHFRPRMTRELVAWLLGAGCGPAC